MSSIQRGLIVTKEELTEQTVITGAIRWQWLFILAIFIAIDTTEWVFAYRNVAYGIGLALFLALGIYVI